MSLFKLTAYGALCAAIYHLFPKRGRWFVLLLLSYGFYAARAFEGLPFILLTTLSTWLCALRIGQIAHASKAHLQAQKEALSQDERRRIQSNAKRRERAWFFAALLLNFALLAVFKYMDGLLGLFGASPLGLLLPLGISFYTFQSMGYLIDVYNGKYAPERNPLKFALFVSFFPQLIQGPIGRYDQLAPQLVKPHEFDFKDMERGGMLILWGLFKKLVIADRALPAVNAVFDAEPGAYGGAVILLAVLLYSLQQYADFSGGIDLVTGIAQLFGIRLAPSFKRPYFSVSLGDFWRRWHISLGAWMRDYVFYPFALTKPVSRLSKAAKRRLGTHIARALPAALGNVLIFLLVGLWHGAASNYILWGLYNGLILAFTALMEPVYKRWNARLPRLTASKGFHVFRILRTFAVVNIGWYFDRCARGADALRMLKTTLTAPHVEQLSFKTLPALGIARPDGYVLMLATLLLFAVSLAQERGVHMRDWVLRLWLPARWLILIGGVVSVLVLGIWGSGFNEASFIYYQF
ncbi:MAG: MBOAT family O-acyltransferase [Clostridia bacterium]|nr:MBOAT family O-acyltransferase [Clostridia bacterium]